MLLQGILHHGLFISTLVQKRLNQLCMQKKLDLDNLFRTIAHSIIFDSWMCFKDRRIEIFSRRRAVICIPKSKIFVGFSMVGICERMASYRFKVEALDERHGIVRAQHHSPRLNLRIKNLFFRCRTVFFCCFQRYVDDIFCVCVAFICQKFGADVKARAIVATYVFVEEQFSNVVKVYIEIGLGVKQEDPTLFIGLDVSFTNQRWPGCILEIFVSSGTKAFIHLFFYQQKLELLWARFFVLLTKVVFI